MSYQQEIVVDWRALPESALPEDGHRHC